MRNIIRGEYWVGGRQDLHILFILAAFGLAVGCTVPKAVTGEKPSGVPVFSVQEKYDTVFHRIARQARQCYEPKGRIIEANLFEKENRAEVIISISIGKIHRKLFRADIKPETPDSTVVKTVYTYSPPGAWRDGAYAFQKWASSEEPYCGGD